MTTKPRHPDGNRATRRARGGLPSNSKRPMAHVIDPRNLFGKLSYLHPTKGYRLRRSPLAALLPSATKAKAAA